MHERLCDVGTDLSTDKFSVLIPKKPCTAANSSARSPVCAGLQRAGSTAAVRNSTGTCTTQHAMTC